MSHEPIPFDTVRKRVNGPMAAENRRPVPAWGREPNGTLWIRCTCGLPITLDVPYTHTVARDGTVSPSVWHDDCPTGWHTFVRLEGWSCTAEEFAERYEPLPTPAAPAGAERDGRACEGDEETMSAPVTGTKPLHIEIVCHCGTRNAEAEALFASWDEGLDEARLRAERAEAEARDLRSTIADLRKALPTWIPVEERLPETEIPRGTFAPYTFDDGEPEPEGMTEEDDDRCEREYYAWAKRTGTPTTLDAAWYAWVAAWTAAKGGR